MKELFSALMLLLCAASASAAADIAVTGAWFRKLPGNLPAGGYFTAANFTARQIAITAARSDACGMLMLHRSRNTGGMNGMDMVEKVLVPPGGQVAFTPGGYHLMCTDPRPALKIGAHVSVVFTLSDGSPLAASFQVRGASGK